MEFPAFVSVGCIVRRGDEATLWEVVGRARIRGVDGRNRRAGKTSSRANRILALASSLNVWLFLRPRRMVPSKSCWCSSGGQLGSRV